MNSKVLSNKIEYNKWNNKAKQKISEIDLYEFLNSIVHFNAPLMWI